jgi:hypothetical protein
MMKLLILASFCFCISGLPLQAEDAPPRDDVLQMVYHEQFDQLEKLTDDLRSQKLGFYEGRSQLCVVYGYLSDFSNDADDKEWQAFADKLQAWANAYPQSPAPLISLGEFYVSWAWKARGSGYANTVTDEGSRMMNERLAKARENLETAEQLPVKDPGVYEGLLQVALGQGWSRGDMEAVFQKGIQIEPNDEQLYESKAYFLLPRWYGLRGEWETFAAEAADARGGDEGDILYMCIARSQAWSEGGDFFKNTSISYARMRRGFEASLRRNPDYLWDENSYCYFACLAGDRDTAQELFRKINGRWEKSVWDSEDYFDQCQHWALADSDHPVFAGSTSPFPSMAGIESIAITVGIAWLVLVVIIAAIIWSRSRKP